MKRPIAILLAVALLISAEAVFARGGRGGGGHAGGGGFHGGARSMGVAGHGAVGFHSGHSIGRPFVGVRPGPVFVGRPPFSHRYRVFVCGTVIVGAPFFYPYPSYPYYPPAYPVPAYPEQPTYIEQGGGVV